MRNCKKGIDKIDGIVYNEGMEEIKTIKKLPVPQEFRKEGYLRKLVKFESRGDNDVAIYEVIRENWEHGSGHRGWEVMDVRYTPKDVEYYGNITPAGTAILPSNEQFGKSGWHFVRWESTIKKFEERLNRPKPKGGRKSSVIFI